MNSEAHLPIETNYDIALHDEINRRAYQLYEQSRAPDRNLKDDLRAELPRTLYALAELKKFASGEVGDIKRVRAAHVYLQALSACIGQQRDH
jgi:hypothetical protein